MQRNYNKWEIDRSYHYGRYPLTIYRKKWISTSIGFANTRVKCEASIHKRPDHALVRIKFRSYSPNWHFKRGTYARHFKGEHFFREAKQFADAMVKFPPDYSEVWDEAFGTEEYKEKVFSH